MPMFSNIDEVARWLDSVVTEFDFDQPGTNSSMAQDCGVAVAEGIVKRSYDQQMGASEVWPENSDEYAKYKEEHYGSRWINVRTSQMLSMASLTANITTTDDGKTAVMNYGTGEPPNSSITGYLEESDKEVTDKEKAAIAHANGRPFFEIDEDIDTQNVMPILAEGLSKYLQKRADS
jgi:hypothetical protein